MELYWLSFRDRSLPDGHSFLGVSIVEADSFDDAVQVAWDMGCNPGGEVLGSDLPPDVAIPKRMIGKLLDKKQATKLQVTMQAMN